jgi:hypothetical protein
MISCLFLAAGLVFTPADAELSYRTAKTLVEECTPRDAGTIRGRLASNCILDAASAAGADVRRDVFKAKTPKGEKTFINLYATFSNGDPSARWVILLSHYDTKAGVKCPGANDGASTTGLLVGLVNALSSWRTPKGNLLLVWTDGEECMEQYGENDGLWGAKRAAEYVESKGMHVQAVICLDMLGDKDLEIKVPANGSSALAKIAVHAARRAGYPGLISLWDENVTDDHVPFLSKGHKAIGLIDFSYGPANSYWHTQQDTIDKISTESLLKSGKVVAEMLNILL